MRVYLYFFIVCTAHKKADLTGYQPYHEKSLLSLVSQGDEKAFEYLMKKYHVGVYSAVLRLTNDQWMAEEVVQDLFLRVWLKRSQLSEIEHFSAWLNKIAQRIALNAIKSSLRKKNDVQSWFTGFYEDLNTADSTKEEHHFAELLKDAVQRLSPRQKEVFTLIKEQGYQREEAARVLNISSETVKTHLEQAMRSIRAYCLSRLDQSTLLVIALIESKFFFN